MCFPFMRISKERGKCFSCCGHWRLHFHGPTTCNGRTPGLLDAGLHANKVMQGWDSWRETWRYNKQKQKGTLWRAGSLRYIYIYQEKSMCFFVRDQVLGMFMLWIRLQPIYIYIYIHFNVSYLKRGQQTSEKLKKWPVLHYIHCVLQLRMGWTSLVNMH